MQNDIPVLQLEKKSDLTLVVLSCDKYSDLWEPFYYYFNLNWPDCPYDKYIVSNYKNPDLSGFNNLSIGEDKSWSENLKKVISLIKSDYVLFILDDLFLNKQVDTNAIKEAFYYLKKANGNYLKLIPQPKPQNKINKYFGELKPKTLYRATTVFTIWKKDVLNEILIPGENPWEFEDKATIRSDRYGGFYSTYNNMLTCHHGVVKGKYISSTVKKMKKDGFDVNTISRPINSSFAEYRFILRIIRHKMFYLFIHPKFRRKVKSLFN